MQKRDAKAIGSRVMAFMKKNIHYILMILCVIAIGAVVTVVAVLNTTNSDIDVIKPDDPSIDVPDEPSTDKKFALVMPVEGGNVLRAFSDTNISYDKTSGRYLAHFGVDISGNVGDKVYAGFDGVVTEVKTDEHFGGMVTIDYGKGRIATFKLLADVAVKKGDKVTEKTVIGKIGKFKFECGEEPHLHYELANDGKLVDPMLYVIGEDK